jgi:hypothetical protein
MPHAIGIPSAINTWLTLDNSIPLSELHLQLWYNTGLSGPKMFTSNNQWILIHCLCLPDFITICKHTHTNMYRHTHTNMYTHTHTHNDLVGIFNECEILHNKSIYWFSSTEQQCTAIWEIIVYQETPLKPLQWINFYKYSLREKILYTLCK